MKNNIIGFGLPLFLAYLGHFFIFMLLIEIVFLLFFILVKVDLHKIQVERMQVSNEQILKDIEDGLKDIKQKGKK